MPVDRHEPGPGGRPRIHLPGDRAKRLPPPEPDVVVVTSAWRATAVAAAGHHVCIASPAALPFRDGSLGGARLDRGLPADLALAAVAECAHALGPRAPIRIDTRVRYGSTGLGRWLAAKLVGARPPTSPETVARRLLEAGFDRIEQLLDGSLGCFRALRLPGRRREAVGGRR